MPAACTGVTDVAQCLMVGDRKYDILGAHAVGMDGVGVPLYGYGCSSELEEAGADTLCEDVPALRQLLLA